MKKYTLIYLLLFLSSCSQDNDELAQPQTLLAGIAKNCSTPNTDVIQEVIQEYVNETSSTKAYQYLLTGSYQGRTIFIFGNCCPFCNTVITAYDCSGNYLGYVDSTNGGREGAIDDDKISNKARLWPKTPNCSF